MLQKILPFLNKMIPASLAIKGIAKVNPNLGSFITNSLGVGYTADNVLDYLREQTESTETKRLKAGKEKGNLTAEERISLKNNSVPDALKTAASTVIGIGAGIGAEKAGIREEEERNRAINPDEILEAEEMPQDQLQLPNMSQQQRQLPSPGQAGREQQAPIPNGQINQGMSRQAQARSGNPQEEAKEPMPLDVLSAYSPELTRFIQSQIENGIVPEEAAWMAKNHSKFRKMVLGIEKETNEDFREFIVRLLGGGKKKGMMQQEQERFQKGYGQQQQKGQGDQALIAALDKILKM